MKYSNYLHFAAVLFSAHCLLAQDPTNRLEVVGDRLREEESRPTDNKESTLLSEDLSFQIGQGAKITTNYELPTTNCDNALRCHLMMNPALEEAEEAIEKLIVGDVSHQSSVTCDEELANHQSSFDCVYSNRPQLPSSAAVAVSPVSMRPVGRIATSSVVTVHPPFQQTIQLNHTTSEQSGYFIQSAPPQEVGSERLPSVSSPSFPSSSSRFINYSPEPSPEEVTDTACTAIKAEFIRVCAGFEAKVNQANSTAALAQDRAQATRENEGVMFWDRSIQATQELEVINEKYLKFLNRAVKNEEYATLQEDCNRKLGRVKKVRSWIGCTILEEKTNRAVYIACDIYSKAVAAGKEKKAKSLWNQSIQADQEVVLAQEKHLKYLQDVGQEFLGNSVIDWELKIERVKEKGLLIDRILRGHKGSLN